MAKDSVRVAANTERTIELQLARLVRGLEAVRSGQGADAALDRAAYLLLEAIDGGAGSAARIAEQLHLDQSTISRQLAVLERRGLAQRGRDPDGGRADVVAMTVDGRQALDAERSSRAKRIGAVLATWDDGERAELARLLTQLNEAIDVRTAALAAGVRRR